MLMPFLNLIKKVWLATVLCFCVLISFAQSRVTVKGVVKSTTGEPIEGVSVVLQNGTTGTSTNVLGQFSIDAPINGVLVFTGAGLEKQQVTVKNASELTIVLTQVSDQMDQVVVVGYRTQTKKLLTASVSSVKKEILETSPVGNVTQTLQGSAPGVNVTTSSQPGSDAQIRIRGLGTINNNNPLWVIDGVPRTSGLNEINPDDIQTLTILKDAASTAIYGARGANGVIVVTTVQGTKSRPPQVNVSGRVGFAKNVARYDLLDVNEYGEMLWLQAKNSNVAPSHPAYGNGATPHVPKYLLPAGSDVADLSMYDIRTYPITESNAAGTDWQKEIFTSGVTQEYNVSVNGGSEHTTYAFSAGYLNEGGIVKHTGFERFTISGNVNSTLKKWLKIGQNIRLSQVIDKGLQEEGESGATGVIPQLTAIMPVYDVMGNYAPLSRLAGFDPFVNPVGDLERGEDFRRERLAVAGNLHAIIELPFKISFKTLFGYTLSRSHDKQPLEANPDSYQARADHQLTEAHGESNLWNFTNTLSYSKKLSSVHNIEALLGTEAISNYDAAFSATRTKYLIANQNYWVLDAGQGVQTNSGSASDWSTFSYFGHLHYDYDGKYLVDAVFRRDGSSRFSSGNKYGNFPAFAAGWVVSGENFMASTERVLNLLKLRASWGRSGNDQIGNYNGYTTFRTDNSFSAYPFNGSNSSFSSGFESLAFGNPNAKWETTTTLNFGIDATLFKNFDLTVDLWQRKTSDMLYPKGIPAVYGLANVPSVNIGDMSNKGIDIALNYRGKALRGDLRYSVGINFTHYKNKILKLSDAASEAIIGSSYREHVYTRAQAGTAFPEFYGYKIEGIFQTQEEAAKHPAFGTYNAPGRFKFTDVNGDGVISDLDRTYIGSPHPDFISGLNLNVGYKQFDLAAIFYASVGNDIANVLRRSTDFNFFQKNRSKRRLYESWGSPYLDDNMNAKMPIAEIGDATSQLPSTYFIEDGSFFRLQNLQIGYSFPKQFLNRISITSCRFYIMATNLFTITKYSGLDPQIQTTDRTFGIDYGVWPAPKRFLFGINITL